jgi:membrane-associated phospholipid phosphatase
MVLGKRRMRRLTSSVIYFIVAFIASAAPANAQDPFSQLFTSNGADQELFKAQRLPDWKAPQKSGPDPFNLSLLQGSAQRPPERAHTGLAALVYTTAADFKAFPKRRSTWVILAIGGAAAALAHPADDAVNEQLVGSSTVGRFFAPGKYVGSTYAQAGAAVTLYAVGRYMLPRKDGEPRTNKASHLGFDLLRSVIVSQALTQAIKHTVRRDRPTGECCAFPSGHASTAFATASVLERHFGYRGAWPTFAVASYVAMSRLHDNRHFLSDVLFGAALGIASGWTVVGRHGRSDYTLLPVPVPGGVAVTLSRTAN